ncbi:hypothetical protein ACA910_008177 [Epithemia clementina (nom. ined.)]
MIAALESTTHSSVKKVDSPSSLPPSTWGTNAGVTNSTQDDCDESNCIVESDQPENQQLQPQQCQTTSAEVTLLNKKEHNNSAVASSGLVANADSITTPSKKATRINPEIAEVHQVTKRHRRSARNTNRLCLSKIKSSLEYRRLEQLFFCEKKLYSDGRTSCNDDASQDVATPSSAPNTTNTIQIGKLTLKQIHWSPNIYVIDNFLKASELDYFQQKIGKGGFHRSYVDAVGGKCEEEVMGSSCHTNGQVDNITDDSAKAASPQQHHPQQQSTFDDDHRTSTFLSFQKQQDRVISAIEQRAATLLGCWSPVTRVEPLQLVRYRPGQFFGIHHDMGDLDEASGNVSLPPKSWFVKRRVATVFCYLNDMPSPDAGGETYFPQASNLAVPPQQGRAVLFCNIRADGSPDPRTVHAGNKVVEGTKYGLNVWICES